MLKTLRFHLSRVSSNAKTGPIPVSTSSKATCPTCPFMGNGCYAASGPLATIGSGHPWRTVARRSLTSWLRSARYRLASYGVTIKPATCRTLPGRISRRFIRGMTAANRGRRGFTYTHHDLTKGENLSLIRYANRNGFTVNVSTESEAAADRAIAAGLPAVIAVPSTETRTTWRTPDGNVVLVCPAQRSDTKTCSDCQLCSDKRGRRVVIAFVAHGTAKRKADQAIAAAH
jgi:hypothetical protein